MWFFFGLFLIFGHNFLIFGPPTVKFKRHHSKNGQTQLYYSFWFSVYSRSSWMQRKALCVWWEGCVVGGVLIVSSALSLATLGPWFHSLPPVGSLDGSMGILGYPIVLHVPLEGDRLLMVDCLLVSRQNIIFEMLQTEFSKWELRI